MRAFLRGLISVAVLLVAGTLGHQASASLVHQYRLDGTFADDLGGPSLSPLGGVLGATSYAFGPSQGLSLSNALPSADNYSIEMIFNFHDLSGYRKIIDFKALSSDNGFYNLNAAPNFFPIVTGPVTFVSDVDARVILTRDSASNVVTAYFNGVSSFSFVDGGGDAIFSAANNIINFFVDDFATGQREASAGVVDLIRIYDAPLTAGQVADLGGPGPVNFVPEPATVFTGSLALVALCGSAIRRRRSARVVA